MKKRTNIVLSLVGLLSLLVLPFVQVAPAAAASPVTQLAICKSPNSFLGFSPWYACLPGGNQGEPRVERLEDLLWIIFPLLESLVKIGALVAVGFIFYALINMITARGNMQKVGKAMETIRDAVVGFVICLISVAIVNFISGRFTP
jgi:hypothetical protein